MPKASDFGRRIDNPVSTVQDGDIYRSGRGHLPFRTGTQGTYIGTGADTGQKVVVTVLKRTKIILVVKATVVRDIVTMNGELLRRPKTGTPRMGAATSGTSEKRRRSTRTTR